MRKLLFFLFFVISILFVSQSALAVSLSSNGEVHTVTQGNLQFKTDGSGLVKLFKNGDYLSSFGFTLKGTVNAQQKFLNSWSTSWSWQVLSNTDSNITVLGSTTWQGLDWKQKWFFSDTGQKFTNYLTNNTGFDVTDTSFYYVVRFDPTNVSCLHYVDNGGKGNKYCFEQDITKTQNLGQYLKRISFMETMFNFQDLVDSGFEFNYLFAGQLNNVKPSLAGQGFIIGVTKNGGLFPNGASIELDPSVIDVTQLSLTNYGNTIVRDSSGNIFTVQEVVTDGGSNTDIFVSKSTDDGVSFTSFNLTNSNDTNESLPHLDINSTDGLIIEFDGNNSRAVYVTTCSSGGCDSNAEFLDKLDVSACGITKCANGNIVHDQNGTSHVSYAKGESSLHYRSNTGFVGASWGAEEDVGSVGGGAVIGRDGTGILVANNGSGIKIVFTNANGAQANIGFFNGTLWSPSVLVLGNPGIDEPVAGFAGYDGNFYVTYTQDISGASQVSRVHFRQCSADCNILGNWSADLNVSTTQNNMFVSIFQSADLNVNILASGLVGTVGTDIDHFVRTPNNVFTTSSLADGNTLFSDSNRNYNPLVRSRGYDGSVLGLAGLPTTGNIEMDYVFLTSNNAQGDPSTLVFDSNSYAIANGIVTSFTTKPISPIALDPEEGITNVLADFNSTTEFFPPGVIVDINYLWQVDGEEISTDQNTVRDFNGADNDFNVSLIVSGNDGATTFTSQNNQNILLRSAPQNIDINFAYNDFANNVDMNFGVTASGTINFAVWSGTDFDTNLLGIDINKTYTTDGIKQVCVIVNGAGDVNKLHCENFTSTRVLVKRPKDKVSDIILTPFDVATNDITRQFYSAQTTDINVFLFFESGNDQNVLYTIDFNASYFSSTFLIQTNDTNTFRTIQPLLVLISESVSSVFHVINAITQNTIPDVVIESRQGGVLIESTITDSTGSATLNFVVADTYNLTFIFQGVISLEQEIRPIDTEYFIYLFLEEIITEPQDPESITITFDPSIGQVQEGTDGNFTLTQIVTADRSSITQINIQVDQNGLLFFDTNFTGVPSGGTFSQDFNASSFDSDSPVNVTIIVTSSLIDETKKSISYFIQFTSQVTFLNAINDLGINLGDVGRVVLVVLSSFVVIGGFAQATRNPHILGGIVVIWLGMFTAIGLNENYVVWVPVPVFLFALVGGVAFYLNR